MANLVEIARSFSYKLNVGNYESRDFFCSQKAEVEESEATKTSEALYEFCKKEVMKSVENYKEESLAKQQEDRQQGVMSCPDCPTPNNSLVRMGDGKWECIKKQHK